MASSKRRNGTTRQGPRRMALHGRMWKGFSSALLLSVLSMSACSTPKSPAGIPDRPPIRSVEADASLRRIVNSLCVDPSDPAITERITLAVGEALAIERSESLPPDVAGRRLEELPPAAAVAWIQEQRWCLRSGDPLIFYLHEVHDYSAYINRIRLQRTILKPQPKKTPWWRFWDRD